MISTSPQHKITVSAFITAMSTGKRKAVFDGHVSLICTNTCHHLNPSPCNRQNGGPGMRKKRRKSEKKKPHCHHTPILLLIYFIFTVSSLVPHTCKELSNTNPEEVVDL